MKEIDEFPCYFWPFDQRKVSYGWLNENSLNKTGYIFNYSFCNAPKIPLCRRIIAFIITFICHMDSTELHTIAHPLCTVLILIDADFWTCTHETCRSDSAEPELRGGPSGTRTSILLCIRTYSFLTADSDTSNLQDKLSASSQMEKIYIFKCDVLSHRWHFSKIPVQ